jgi:3D (Asp-Asp-Asp) domain-containing protein
MVRLTMVIIILILPVSMGILLYKGDQVIIKELEVTATCYRPNVRECDSSPLITANGGRIDHKDPLRHRWIAVSRDLLKHVKFNDTVNVVGTGVYDGRWIVKDVMNKRFKRKIDFLIGDKDKGGLWQGVKIQIKKR